MKIFNVIFKEWKPEGEINWRLLPDSSLIKGNNPFFVPDFPGGILCRPGIGVTVGRLGKGIDRKYARSFYGEPFPALVFAAEEYGDMLRRAGRPDAKAYVFDKAVAAGIPSAMETDDISVVSISRAIKGRAGEIETLKESMGRGDFRNMADIAIEEVSFDNTIRNGDMIIITTDPQTIRAIPDTRMAASAEDLAGNTSRKEINIK